MAVTLKEFKDRLAEKVFAERNGGYSGKQVVTRDRVARSVLDYAKRRFPELADELDVRMFSGLGFYNCYSDFMLVYKGLPVVAVSTHTQTVTPTRYTIDYNVRYGEEICRRMSARDLDYIADELTLDDIVRLSNDQMKRDARAGIEAEIWKKREELKALEKKLKTV